MGRTFYRLLATGLIALGLCPALAIAQDGLTSYPDVAQAVEGEAQAASLKAVDVPAPTTGLVYNGAEQEGVRASDAYTVEDGSASEAGSYTATVSLTDPENTTWSDGTIESKQVGWSISPAWITGAEIEIADQVYTGAPLHPDVNVVLGGKRLVEGVDFLAVYYDNLAVGRCDVAVKGIGNYGGIEKVGFKIVERDIEDASVDLWVSDYLSIGLVKKPAVLSVEVDGIELRPGRDYRISYLDGNGKPVKSCAKKGDYLVQIAGIGGYTGTVTEPFYVE